MKPIQNLILTGLLASAPAAVFAQAPEIIEVGPEVVEQEILIQDGGVPPDVVTPLTSGDVEVLDAQRKLDAALARQRLGAAPRLIPAPAPGAPVVVETTTTTVERPGVPTRVYNTERNVVLVEGRELPYLTIPVLFVEGTADLLDKESRFAIEDTAAAIKDILLTSTDAIFDVEGHTSTDGSDEMNLQLSADRARRIHTELIERYSIPASNLAAHGYGENYPKYPDGSEEQMILDRRVLVVRVK